MRGSIGDDQRIAHIHEAIQEIEDYVRGIDIHHFKSNSMIRFASIKQIEIIGEAAKHVFQATRLRFPGVAWQEIAGLRNILVHEYLGLDADLIWQVISVDIPDLKAKLTDKQ